MRSERFWVVVLAVTAFCAGLAAGVLLSFRRVPAQGERPFAAYEADMVEAFDLDEERVRNLRYILEDYQYKIDALKERNIAALDPELVKLGRASRELVRTWVVPPHHHQEFDQWDRGRTVLVPDSKPE